MLRGNTFKQNKVYIFDFFRAIACFGIFIHHVCECSLKIKVIPYFGISGFMAVFFFTTGFLIPLSLDRCGVIKAFLIKRFFRLFPVLLLASVITAHFFGFSVKRILLSVFMINDIACLFGEYKRAIPAPAWSLQVELKFYLLCALTYWLFKKDRTRLYFMIITIILSVFLITKVFNINNWVWNPHYRDMKNFRFSMTFLPCILTGTVWYYYRKGSIIKSEFITLFIICIASYYFDYQKMPQRINSHTLFTFITLFIAYKYESFGNNKIVKEFADNSYSIYLLHGICIKSAVHFFKHGDSVGVLLKNFSFALILFIPLFCACHFIYKYIEKPAYDFGRKLASKMK